MGGRGASAGGFAGGGGIGANPRETTSLVSAREGKRAEVDQALGVARDVQDRYGMDADVNDWQIARFGKPTGVMAYYDSNGNLAINESFFDGAKMNAAYDACVKDGYHPSRGDKTGIEAVTAHELGHRLTDYIGVKTGMGDWQVDKVSSDIVRKAATRLGYKRAGDMASKISGYAKQNPAEAVAEAFADVYCNGSKARRESQAIVTELNRYF